MRWAVSLFILGTGAAAVAYALQVRRKVAPDVVVHGSSAGLTNIQKAERLGL